MMPISILRRILILRHPGRFLSVMPLIPARIAEIRGQVAEHGVVCVLAEPQFNPRLVATVLKGSDAQMGIVDPLGSDLELGSKLYPQLIRHLTVALARCLHAQ